MMGNIEKVVETLMKIDNLRVTVSDFSTISFQEQLLLVARSSILIGMQSPDLTHALHMSIGTELCCGVIEIVPLNNDMSPLRLFKNFVRKMGVYHHKLDVSAIDSTGRSVAHAQVHWIDCNCFSYYLYLTCLCTFLAPERGSSSTHWEDFKEAILLSPGCFIRSQFAEQYNFKSYVEVVEVVASS